MATQTVEFSKIVSDKDWNSRKTYRGVPELAHSIYFNGLAVPVTVRPRKDGGYNLVAGFRRIMALDMILNDTKFREDLDFKKASPFVKSLISTGSLDVEVKTFANEEEAFRHNALENTSREDLSTYDRAQLFLTLQEKYKLKGVGLSSMFAGMRGFSAPNITTFSNIAKAIVSPVVIERWKEEDSFLTIQRLGLIASRAEAKDQEWQLRSLELQESGMAQEDANKKAEEEIKPATAGISNEPPKKKGGKTAIVKTKARSAAEIEEILPVLIAAKSKMDNDVHASVLAAFYWMIGHSATGSVGGEQSLKVKSKGKWITVAEVAPEVKEKARELPAKK